MQAAPEDRMRAATDGVRGVCKSHRSRSAVRLAVLPLHASMHEMDQFACCGVHILQPSSSAHWECVQLLPFCIRSFVLCTCCKPRLSQ